MICDDKKLENSASLVRFRLVYGKASGLCTDQMCGDKSCFVFLYSSVRNIFLFALR